MRWLDRTALGWIQLKHDRTRLLVSLFGVAVADMLMFMQLGILQTNYASATTLHEKLRAELFVISRKGEELSNLFTFPRRRLMQIQAHPGVLATEPLYIAPLPWSHPETRQRGQLLALGLEPMGRGLDLEQLQPLQGKLKLLDHILLDSKSKGDYRHIQSQIEAGEVVTHEVEGHRLKIAGFVPLGTSFMRNGHLICSPSTFLRLVPGRQPGQVSLGLVYVRPGWPIEQVASQLAERLPCELRILSKPQFRKMELDHLNRQAPMTLIFGMMTVVGFVVGAAMMYQILSMDVTDHLPEYATFKAMGYSHGYLLTVVYEQALILSLIGYGPGLGAALLLYSFVRSQAQLPIVMTGQRLLLVLALTILMGLISGTLAASKLRKADPADIF